jgi:hypothetical protein
MINNVGKILNVRETRLRYRKRETMVGLYFKEMLSKIDGSKAKKDEHKESKKENKHKEATPNKDIKHNQQKVHEGEGTFLDQLC